MEGFLREELLERLNRLDEAQASALNPFRYRDFKASYDEYVARWKPCGNSRSGDTWKIT